ncbi:hypothetical protein A9X02_06115 [Mycobacterium malmoense]|nr:hypothetical protein A9X02_06115 [Mycobacterium malmoense]
MATTGPLTSTHPASPCSEALSMVTFATDATEPAPNQLADVVAVLIAEATPEAWWVAARAIQAAWLAR